YLRTDGVRWEGRLSGSIVLAMAVPVKHFQVEVRSARAGRLVIVRRGHEAVLWIQEHAHRVIGRRTSEKPHGTVRHEDVGTPRVEAVDVFPIVAVDDAGARKVRGRRRDGRIDTGDIDEVVLLCPAADGGTKTGRRGWKI